MSAAYILPHSLGFKNTGRLFGDEDRKKTLWKDNRMIISRLMEKALEQGITVLIPIPAPEYVPCRWSVVLIDESYRRRRLDRVIIIPKTTRNERFMMRVRKKPAS